MPQATVGVQLEELLRRAEDIVCTHVAPRAAQTDAACEWPATSMRALAEAGLMGLHVPQRLGGCGQGLFALAVLAETLGRACASTALCYAMHCVGTAVIAAKATRDHEERYLKAIAKGAHLTTLALSEAGTGSFFHLPQTRLSRAGDGFIVDGQKSFVTNGGQCDSYVISTQASTPHAEAGMFSCLVLDRETPGMSWLDPWRGMGMRGNSSRGLKLESVRVPAANLLGQEGDEVWYAFEVVGPYFLIGMAGTYLGVAERALELTIQHLQARSFAHSGQRLAEVPVLEAKLAELWGAVEKTRQLIHEAGRLGDLGDPQALTWILACKAEAGETAVTVTNEAMSLCGGMAYRENGELARLLRDARASHVMTPTTTLLREWTGRSLLGLPIV